MAIQEHLVTAMVYATLQPGHISMLSVRVFECNINIES